MRLDILRALTRVDLRKHFEQGRFGVVSAFVPGYPLRENLARQHLLADAILEGKYACIYMVGRWGRLPERTLFIARIERDQTRELARRFSLPHYVWGLRGTWWCRSTLEDEVVVEDYELQFQRFDDQLASYIPLVEQVRAAEIELAHHIGTIDPSNETRRRRIEELKQKIAKLKTREEQLVRD